MDTGTQASKGDSSACGEVMQHDSETVNFNCKFHENAMLGGGDAFFEKAPHSPIPSRVKPIYMEDQDFVPEELKMPCLPESGYIAGDLGSQGYVFRHAEDVKPTPKSQPDEPEERP
ncbi:hypothetical protein V5799_004738 [Amblyomma americanum]|uniref:Uncharacterized protein n=1 Tax=Amblyomma americanum TaxID=6943 RepID=A0AAQ4D585_AMBAM